MSKSTDSLLRISSEPIVSKAPVPAIAAAFFRQWHKVGEQLMHLLLSKNGFYAYESALLVRPFTNRKGVLGIVEWNEMTLWKGSYECDIGHTLCFAEDVFGCQHCLLDDRIVLFDPETAEFENVADTIEAWAKDIMEDYDYRTGYPLAHEWQMKNEPLSPGSRLLPCIPFVLGGRYEIENLHMINDLEGIRFRADIANQIADVPDGEEIVIQIKNKDEKN